MDLSAGMLLENPATKSQNCSMAKEQSVLLKCKLASWIFSLHISGYLTL